MPSSRPCATFEPISPDFNLQDLVDSAPNFEWVVRIDCDSIDRNGLQSFEELVLRHVIIGGKPLVIQGYQDRLNRELFSERWLRDSCGPKVVDVRDLTKQTNVPMTMAHYLKHMGQLTDQWTTHNFKDSQRQRMYLKDIDCPKEWQDSLKDIIPPHLFYLNGDTNQSSELSDVDKPRLANHESPLRRNLSTAGDLMSSLPTSMRADNLMCYIGHEGTYTPCHQEMCASLGQNIMVEASTGAIEDGLPTHPGSSVWFMTESKEREVVSEYWLSCLGHDIEVENHFAQVNAWRNAPFKTYVVEQVPGDFILVPPLAPHQVWNRGTRTMKVAWNRTTVETLELALTEALPKARMVCRDEQYKNKAIIYYTLEKYAKLLEDAVTFSSQYRDPNADHKKLQRVRRDFKNLHSLFTRILVAESFTTNQKEDNVEMAPFDGNVTCSYCRCNIFNRFLTCPSCIDEIGDGQQDTYDICLDCYAMGRSCACIAKLRWVEQFEWDILLGKHELWRQQIVEFDSHESAKSFMPFTYESNKPGSKRSLAQICRLELSRRPWHDITKSESVRKSTELDEGAGDSEDDNAKKKKRKFKHSKQFYHEHGRCHIDGRWEPKWKQVVCTFCKKCFCYANLFRGYDMMPAEIMADPNWLCPSCQKICGCRYCRTKPGYTKYVPHSTFLGHNTKEIADDRSVESLVDFSVSNITWIRKVGDDHPVEDTQRMERYLRKAEEAKLRDLDPEDICPGDAPLTPGNALLPPHSSIVEPVETLLDPALATIGTTTNSKLTEPTNGATEEIEERSMVTSSPIDEGGIIRDLRFANNDVNGATFTLPGRGSLAQSQPSPDHRQFTRDYNSSEILDEIGMIIRKRKRNGADEPGQLSQPKHNTNTAQEEQENNAINTSQRTFASIYVPKTIESGTNEKREPTRKVLVTELHHLTSESQLTTKSSNLANTKMGDMAEGLWPPGGIWNRSTEPKVLITTSASGTSGKNSILPAKALDADDRAKTLASQLDGSSNDSRCLHRKHQAFTMPIDFPEQSNTADYDRAIRAPPHSLISQRESVDSSSKDSVREDTPVCEKVSKVLPEATKVPARSLKPLNVPKASTSDWDESSEDETLPKASIRSRVANRSSVAARSFALQVNKPRAKGTNIHEQSGRGVKL